MGKPGKRQGWRKSLEASKQAQTRVWFSATDLFQPLWLHASWTRSIEEIWNRKSCRSNFWERRRRRRRKSGSFQLELSWYLGVFFPFRNLAQLLLLFWVSKLSAWVLCILLGWHLCLCVSVLCLGEGAFCDLVWFASLRLGRWTKMTPWAQCLGLGFHTWGWEVRFSVLWCVVSELCSEGFDVEVTDRCCEWWCWVC